MTDLFWKFVEMDKEWLKSKCMLGYLHKFNIFKITDKYVHEICERCQQEEAFIIINGKTDNLNYLDYHLRSCLVPAHPYYEAEYGKRKLETN